VAAGNSNLWEIVRVEKDGTFFEGRYYLGHHSITVAYGGSAIASTSVSTQPYAQASMMLKRLLTSGRRAKQAMADR
jgi:hypothetical protein